MCENYLTLRSGKNAKLKKRLGNVDPPLMPFDNLMYRLWFFVLLLFLSLGQTSWAQSITNYSFSSVATGSLEDVSSGATSLMTGNQDDTASTVNAIGFDFYFMGTKYTHFSANSNGQVLLHTSSGATAISGGNITSPSSNVAMLAPMCGDNEVNNGMRFKVLGIAPNRKFVLEWNQFYAYYTNITNSGNMQLWLNETTGVIEYIYGSIYNSNTSAVTRSIGIASSNTATTAGYVTVGALPTFTAASSFTTNSFAASVLIADLASSSEGSRRVYTFTPFSGNPSDPITFSASPVGQASMTVNWVDSSTNETYFTIGRSTSVSGPFTIVGTVSSTTAAGTGSAYLLAQTGLQPNTTYYYEIKALNESGGISSALTASQTTLPAGNFVSTATGNWSDGSTWVGGIAPTIYDNVIIANGNTVTIDATGQGANNLTIGQGVSGVLDYGATPSSFAITGNLTVGAGAFFNVFNGTTGKSVSVAGNIVNDGEIDLSKGTGSNALTLNGTTVQTVGGSGVFTTGVIRNLVFNNTATAIPNINWNFDNISVGGTLTFTAGRVALGANKMILGTGTATGTGAGAVGALSYASGGFTNGKFVRNWTAAGTGSSITAGSDPGATNGTSRYPFVNANGQQRSAFIERTGGLAAGQLSCAYVDAATNSAMSIVDGAYTVEKRYDGNWTFSTEGSPYAANTQEVLLLGNGAYTGYIVSNGNSRIVLASGNVGGTHQNGTTTPGAQRILTVAELTAGPVYMGLANADLQSFVTSIASGNWNDASTWDKGAAPSCDDIVNIASGHTVTVNTAASLSKNVTVNSGGILAIASGDLTVGCTLNNNTFVNNGTLSVNGGTLNVNGSFHHNSGATFNQIGGDINIDGNNAGNAANSVASGTSIVQISTNLLGLTGGTLTIVDPHANTTASNSFAYNGASTHVDIASGHTLKFGNGVSTDAGGSTNGFRINTYVGSYRISFFNVIIDAGAGTNRFVSSTYGYGINGNLTINANSEYRDSAITTYIAGNLSNNGTYVSTGALYLGSFLNATAVASTNAQSISGAGVFANATTSPTASLSTLTINNTNASGVTLSTPLSLSGTLNLTAGKVNTTDINLLTVGTTTAAATISGGSSTAYINGPLSRTIANANTSYILFPIGKTVYAPISIAPTTTTVAVFKAQTFDTNTGTNDASLVNLSATRRWEVSPTSGTYTDANVRLADSGIITSSIPVQAPSAAGVYTNAFGSLATYAAGTPNTTQSNTAVTAANFTGFVSYADSNVCSGTPAPGNTLASATQICLGTTVSFSLQNTTAGTGVTYVWESSTDGIAYTPIDGATSATYTVAPSIETYYRAQVTCSGNTGTSTAVQVTFTNNVTGTTPATRCGVGTVSLEAAASPGATLSWYDAATGGNQLGTGSPFITPSVGTTTDFYVAAESNVAGNATIGAATTLTGATSQPTAFCNRWPNYWSQTIYTAAELTAAGLKAGNITSLGYNITTLGDGASNANFTIKIGANAGSSFANSTFLDTTSYTTVYGPSTYIHSASGWQVITFVTPYVWDGVSNIVVNVTHNGADATNNSQTYYTATAANTTLWATSFTGTTTTGTTSVNRLNIMFGGQVACSSPRVAVTATVTTPPTLTLSANPPVICEGETSSVVTLVSGAGDYDTFVWSSPTEVSGDAVNGWVFTPTATTTYTLAASQSGGALCGTTATVVVNVNPLPSILAITPPAPPAPVCAGTILPLTVTGGSSFGADAIIGTETTLTGATAQPTAFCNRWPNYWSQTIYTAAELTAAGLTAGNISSLAYNIATLGDGANNAAFTIKIGATTDSSFANTTFVSTTGFTNVYGPATYTHTASGWQQIVFSAPYVWDGVSNIIINVTHNGADSTNNAQTYYTATASNTTLWATSFSGTTTTGTTSVNRLNIKFIQELPVTTSWSPITNLYSDATATTPYVANANTKTVYFKSTTAGLTTYTISSENDGTGCTRTATVDVTTNALPSLVVTSPAAVCSPSTVDITAAAVTAGSDAGLTLTYWADPNATVTFPSPNAIASSGMFYIKAVNGNNCSVISPVTVTVNALPSLVVTSPAAACFPATVDITAAAVTAGSDTGLTLTYWADPNATVTFPDPNAIASSGTFYIKAVNANSCSVISPVVVTVNTTAIPTGDDTQAFDNAATVADLEATGDGIQWYDAATEGTLLAPGTALVNGGVYYASQTTGGCESATRFQVTVTITSTIIDYANLQFPGTQTISEGGSFDIYAQVYDAGVTEAAGANVAITAWIGYSSTNENPNSASFTWIPANYNVQSGNNDEYSISLGATLPVGTYYYASRFQVNGGDFAYGGYSASNGGFWDGTANVNGVLTVQLPVITYANIQFPGTAEIEVGATETIYAQVYAQGVTEAAGAGTGITAWIGYSSTNENPNAASFTWVPASFNTQSGNNDEFSSAIGSGLTAGTYYYASRFQLSGGDFVYGGYSAGGGGFWNGTTNINGILTVNCGVVEAPTGTATQDFTTGQTLADFVVVGENIIWYDAATDGTILPATTVLVSGTVYYASQTIGGCESAERLAVTAGIDLKTPGFDAANLKYYPNPVQDVLTIDYSDTIDSIEIYNVVGQRVYQKRYASQQVKVDMSSLATGSYIVNVTSKGLVKNIKIIKK